MAGDQSVFEQAMSDGNSAAWEQQWQAAVTSYRAALQEFPDHPEALANLGLALFELKEDEDALEVYQRVVVLDPTNPIPQEKIAHIYERNGRLEEAIDAEMQAAELYYKMHDVEKSVEDWEHVIRLQPENQTAYNRLGVIYERLNRKPQAVQAYLNTASLLQRSGKPEKARLVVDYVLKILPDSPEAFLALQILKTGGQLPRPSASRSVLPPSGKLQVTQQESGKNSISNAAWLDPISEAHHTAIAQLAALMFEKSDDESEPTPAQGLKAIFQGLNKHAQNLKKQNKIFQHLNQAIELQAQDRDKEAGDEFLRVLAAGFSHPALLFEIGRLLMNREETRALRSLEQILECPDYSLAATMLLGNIDFAGGKIKEAVVHILQAMRAADMETILDQYAAELEQVYGSFIPAQVDSSDESRLKTIYQTISAQLNRVDWRAYFSRVRSELCLPVAGQPPLPLAALFIEAKGGNIIEALLNIQNLAAHGMPQTALEEAYYVLDQGPTYLPLHTTIADLLLQDGDQNGAIEKYSLVIQSYSVRGEVSRAIGLLRRLIQTPAIDATARHKLVDSLAAKKHLDPAILQVAQGISI